MSSFLFFLFFFLINCYLISEKKGEEKEKTSDHLLFCLIQSSFWTNNNRNEMFKSTLNKGNFFFFFFEEINPMNCLLHSICQSMSLLLSLCYQISWIFIGRLRIFFAGFFRFFRKFEPYCNVKKYFVSERTF